MLPGIFLLNAEGEMGTGTESNVALPLNAQRQRAKKCKEFRTASPPPPWLHFAQLGSLGWEWQLSSLVWAWPAARAIKACIRAERNWESSCAARALAARLQDTSACWKGHGPCLRFFLS